MLSRTHLFALVPLVALVAGGAAACSHPNIPNTDVEDNSENRKILGYCERYRRAVEDRDADLLASMASGQYFETGGNAKPTDDIDLRGFKSFLDDRFRKAKAVRYEIR